MLAFDIPPPVDDEEDSPITPEFNVDGEPLPHQGRKFCMVDPNCPCHEDEELIAETMAEYQDGLLTPEEATRMVRGDTI